MRKQGAELTINFTAVLCKKVVIVIVHYNDVLIRMIKRSYEYFQEKVLEENKMESEKLENINRKIILVMQK